MLTKEDFQKKICNGLSLEVLERRLRPADKFSEDDILYVENDRLNGFSQVGFIGIDENLMDTIYDDYKIVEESNTDYSALASAIDGVIRGTYPLNENYEYSRSGMGTAGNQDCPWGCRSNEPYYSYGQNEGIISLKKVPAKRELELEVRKQGCLTDKRVKSYCKILMEPKPKKKSTLKEFEAQCKTIGLPVNDDARQFYYDSLKKKHPSAKEAQSLLDSLKTKQDIIYVPLTGLLSHLINEHNFFEGKESPYRVDLGFLINALNLNC